MFVVRLHADAENPETFPTAVQKRLNGPPESSVKFAPEPVLPDTVSFQKYVGVKYPSELQVNVVPNGI